MALVLLSTVGCDALVAGKPDPRWGYGVTLKAAWAKERKRVLSEVAAERLQDKQMEEFDQDRLHFEAARLEARLEHPGIKPTLAGVLDSTRDYRQAQERKQSDAMRVRKTAWILSCTVNRPLLDCQVDAIELFNATTPSASGFRGLHGMSPDDFQTQHHAYIEWIRRYSHR